MGHEGAANDFLAAARNCLERWDVAGAREGAEAARARASAWGDCAGVLQADALLARAALLVTSEPSVNLLRETMKPGDSRTPAATAARARFLAEVASASETAIAPVDEWPSLQPTTTTDAVAAVAILGTLLLGDPSRIRKRIVQPSTPLLGVADHGGWEHLIAALHAEAQGLSGWQELDRALSRAEREGRIALLWTTLCARLALCERRGAHAARDSVRIRQRTVLEQWALGLPAADAQSALRRPDRVACQLSAMSRTNTSAAGEQRLLETALALAEQRDPERVSEMALDAAIAALGAERGILILLDATGAPHVATKRYVAESAQDLVGFSTTIAQRALREGEVIIANDVRSDPRFSDCSSVSIEVASVLCAPIHARGELEGALYLDRHRGGRPFDEAAVATARALGSMIAAALLTARVIASLTEKTKELEATREELSAALASRTLERDDMGRRLANVTDALPVGTDAIVGRAPAMLRMRRTIEMVAPSDAPVLIGGETGSGKELVARALHAASARRDRPFVAINCGALSESLLAAELFGAERGSYTGATSARPGLFVSAHQGTLFLDEVGDMPPSMQTALLRVLETSEFRPVGSVKSRSVDVRILAASHRDLVGLVRSGTFRDDLRYRLEVIRIEVPPLRDHLEDLPELCAHLLRDVQKRYGLPEKRMSPAAIHALSLRPWPGNVRELRHVLAGAALAADGPVITPDDIPSDRTAQTDSAVTGDGSRVPDIDGHSLRADSIRRALRATGGNRGRAAKLLGISRSTLYRYLESHDVAAREGSAPPEATDERD